MTTWYTYVLDVFQFAIFFVLIFIVYKERENLSGIRKLHLICLISTYFWIIIGILVFQTTIAPNWFIPFQGFFVVISFTCHFILQLYELTLQCVNIKKPFITTTIVGAAILVPIVIALSLLFTTNWKIGNGTFMGDVTMMPLGSLLVLSSIYCGLLFIYCFTMSLYKQLSNKSAHYSEIYLITNTLLSLFLFYIACVVTLSISKYNQSTNPLYFFTLVFNFHSLCTVFISTNSRS